MWTDKPRSDNPKLPPPILAVRRDDNGDAVVQIDPASVHGPHEVAVLLVELSRQYAHMFAQTGQARSEELALQDIRQFFNAEWEAS